MKKEFETTRGDIEGCLKFIHSVVDERKMDKKEKVLAILAAEEALVNLDKNADENAKIRIGIKNQFGNTIIWMKAAGEAFDFFGEDFLENTTEMRLDTEGMSADTEGHIRSILLKTLKEKIKYSNKNNENKISINIARSRYRTLFLIMGGMILGILTGLLLSAILPESANAWINKNILSTVTTVFMNALKIVIAPVVFFSIVTSVSGFGNLSELGRIGAKTFGFYMMTSVLAIIVGLVTFMFLKTGDPALATQMAGDVSQIASDASNSSVSLLDTFINIVPDNFVKPFLNSDMLQVIFLAVICGITVSLLGEKTKMISTLFDNCNELFMKITTIFMKVIPIATFCSMCAMVLTTGISSLLSVLSIVGGFIASIAQMIIVYMILLLIFTRTNPLRLLAKYFPTMLQVFSICSSNACIPLNMKTCRDELGIHPRIFSLTIPLGATINMDGASISLIYITLSFCHIFGVGMTPHTLIPLMVMILMLSIGAPGIPNAGLVLLAMLAEQVNVPVEAVALIMGVYPIIDMFSTANNCLGDVVGTFIVAKSEGMVDMEVFRKQR
ncbi:MAG: dicarboxylate/amino acid:cation symporter [Eubacterium sp.]|nr:dicarboxylate/amino acid:cation symporter [Eubacterium sp.]